jgi:hypothetical protein
MWLKKLFKKNRSNSKNENVYAYLGSIGVSPDKLYVYQESIKLIEEFESKYRG